MKQSTIYLTMSLTALGCALWTVRHTAADVKTALVFMIASLIFAIAYSSEKIQINKASR